jgi:hypothetical protein
MGSAEACIHGDSPVTRSLQSHNLLNWERKRGQELSWMKCSSSSRATGSGYCTGGDFMK